LVREVYGERALRLVEERPGNLQKSLSIEQRGLSSKERWSAPTTLIFGDRAKRNDIFLRTVERRRQRRHINASSKEGQTALMTATLLGRIAIEKLPTAQSVDPALNDEAGSRTQPGSATRQCRDGGPAWRKVITSRDGGFRLVCQTRTAVKACAGEPK